MLRMVCELYECEPRMFKEQYDKVVDNEGEVVLESMDVWSDRMPKSDNLFSFLETLLTFVYLISAVNFKFLCYLHHPL